MNFVKDKDGNLVARYNETNVTTTKEQTAPYTTKETKVFSYGYVEKGVFVEEITKTEVAYYYDTDKAVKDAIAASNIDELHRLFNVTNNYRMKRKIFHAVVDIYNYAV